MSCGRRADKPNWLRTAWPAISLSVAVVQNKKLKNRRDSSASHVRLAKRVPLRISRLLGVIGGGQVFFCPAGEHPFIDRMLVRDAHLSQV